VISDPGLERLVRDFHVYSRDEDATFKLRSLWSFTREQPAGAETTTGDLYVQIPMIEIKPFIDLIEKKTIDGDRESAKINVPNTFPKILQLSSDTRTTELDVITKDYQDVQLSTYIDIDLELYRAKDGAFYWKFEIAEDQGLPDRQLFVEQEEIGQDEDLVLLLYNEAVMGSILTSFASMSVVGVYIAVVLAVGQFLRLLFDRYSSRAIYEELPDTEKLFEICEGIFIAQLEGDLKKEKRLYDLLIIIYRSPDLMIKITGRKQHY
jgi:hypothetical protein